MKTPTIQDAPTKLLEDLTWFITGSVRWGTANSDSDLDICVLHECDFMRWLHALNSTTIDLTPSKYNHGFHFNHEEVKVNIIPLPKIEYYCWLVASNLVVTGDLINKRTEKHAKGGIFEGLRAIIKMSAADKFAPGKGGYLLDTMIAAATAHYREEIK